MRLRLFPLFLIVVALSLTSCGTENGADSGSAGTWEKSIGGEAFEQARAVLPTADGGYLIAGVAGLDSAANVYLVKISRNGDVIWERTIGGAGEEAVKAAIQTADGGYLIVGNTNSLGYGMTDSYLLKVDGAGNKTWERAYGGSADDYSAFAVPLSSTGYLLAGTAQGFDAENTSIVVIRTDATGLQLDRTVYGSDNASEAFTGAATPDGGAIVVGTDPMSGGGFPDVYLLRFDAEGELQWENSFGGDRAIRPHSVAPTPDGGYIIAGDVLPPGVANSDAYLAKTDASGNLTWEQAFGSDQNEEIHSVVPADDGYILAGWTLASIIRGTDAYLVKTDDSGNVVWERTFGGDSFDEAYAVTPTPDGGYLMVGRTASFGTGGGDFYLIKTDANGEL